MAGRGGTATEREAAQLALLEFRPPASMFRVILAADANGMHGGVPYRVSTSCKKGE
jgi:hypothetical protein